MVLMFTPTAPAEAVPAFKYQFISSPTKTGCTAGRAALLVSMPPGYTRSYAGPCEYNSGTGRWQVTVTWLP